MNDDVRTLGNSLYNGVIIICLLQEIRVNYLQENVALKNQIHTFNSASVTITAISTIVCLSI